MFRLSVGSNSFGLNGLPILLSGVLSYRMMLLTVTSYGTYSPTVNMWLCTVANLSPDLQRVRRHVHHRDRVSDIVHL